ncbi:MAG: response regulator [Lentimicrobiaceae bacterium]|nr:response regulator [Lentimicrobiaceae bacterium]
MIQNILSMFSSHGVGIWEYEIVADKFNFVNDYFHVLNLENSKINFSNRNEQSKCIHTEDIESYQKAFDTAIKTQTKDTSVMYRLMGKEDSILWFEDHFFFVEKTAESEAKILAYTTKADAIKIQEAKAIESEAHYRQLVNVLFPDFIFVFDENFDFVDIILPEGLRLFHNNDEVIGTSGRNLYSPEVSDLFEVNIKETLETGKVKEIEYHLDLFGTRYYYQARLVPIPGRKIFTLIRDIGDRVRRMEDLLESRRKAQEADKLKSAFLANMSHEIRTPLNAIIGFTEILISDEEHDPESVRRYTEIIHSNNELLLQLVNDVLELSQLESGRNEIVLKKTNVKNLIDEVFRTQRLKIKKGLQFNVVAPEEDIWVYTDPNRIKQVLFNFISNASKNTEKGSITLSVMVEENQLKFAVKDTGKGIPENRIHEIFNRFEKLDIFTQGTGLGLSIAKEVVERLGGEIKVESEVGVGSTFSFGIPYKDEMTTLMNATKIEEGRELPSKQRKKILVGEDSPENYKIIEETLGKRYELIWVTDGEELVNSFILENPNLVLLSIQLPVLSGIDAIKKIRSISQSVPIIGVTSNDFYLEQKWAVESGCNDVISKPYSAIKIEEIVTVFI